MKTIIAAVLLSLFTLTVQAQAKKSKIIDTTANQPESTPTMFRMHYDDLFRQNADASYSPKLLLMINGEMVGTNTKIARGVRYGGIDLLGSFGHDMMVDTAKGVVIIRQVVK